MDLHTLVSSFIEFVCIVAGIFGFVCGFRSMKLLSVAAQEEALWIHFGHAIAWSLGGALFLGLDIVFGGRSMSVLLMVLVLSGTLVGVSILIVAIRLRRLKQTEVVGATDSARKSHKVHLKSIVPGRVRGLDDGNQIQLDKQGEDALKGAKGFVRMVPWEIALKARDFNGNTPLLGFWNEDGTRVLLYSDDVIELVKEGV